MCPSSRGVVVLSVDKYDVLLTGHEYYSANSTVPVIGVLKKPQALPSAVRDNRTCMHTRVHQARQSPRVESRYGTVLFQGNSQVGPRKNIATGSAFSEILLMTV